MKHKTIATAVAAALFAGAAGAWGVNEVMQHKTVVAANATDAAVVPAVFTAAAVAPLADGAPNYRAIVNQYGPAVVGITVEGSRRAAAAQGDEEDFFRFFRGLPGPRGQMPRGEAPVMGKGSGFIVSADGLILTNAHVVQNAKEVTVKLKDRREYTAKVLGLDTATDVAVLKVEASGLPTVQLGSSNDVQVGDRVLAIGAPYGLEQTATQGIVSAKGRSLPGDTQVPFIQTDAAVNPGNSGGPLFDGTGRVVGINAQIYSQSGGFQGLAFAIPIEVALNVKDQIVATGKVQHARMGVLLQEMNQGLAESFGLKKPDGALVAKVEPNSAAAAAGLQAGDVILSIDGKPVEAAGNVSSRVGLAKPGETVKLSVWRDKAERAVEVKLGTARAEQTANAEPVVEKGQLGLAVRPLSPEEKKQTGADHGLVVQQAAGPAARAGIAQGDILLSINGKKVESIDSVKQVLADKPKRVAVLIQRDEQRIFVPIDLG
ncbi:MAG: Do family serine endopeptidase [Betaproteobacteria bacterium]